MDDPASGRRAGLVVAGVRGKGPGGGEDVVEAFAAGVRAVRVDGAGLRPKPLAGGLRPAPGVVDAVAGRAVDLEVEAGGGHGEAPRLLGGVVGGAEGAVRVEDAPGVAEGAAGGDDAVGEGARGHVEVAEGDDEAAGEGGGAEELCDFPCLGCAVAEVGVVGGPLVRGVSLVVKFSMSCLSRKGGRVLT